MCDSGEYISPLHWEKAKVGELEQRVYEHHYQDIDVTVKITLRFPKHLESLFDRLQALSEDYARNVHDEINRMHHA